MKKPTRKSVLDVRPEYSLDYTKAKPNRFASELKKASVIVLDPDVATVFTSSKAVNSLLRSAITATAKPAKKAPTAGRSRRSAA